MSRRGSSEGRVPLRPGLAGALVGAFVALLAGCGWHAGLATPDGARTLGIRFLANDGPLRDLEADLTRAISDSAVELVALLPAEPSSADLVVQGRILDYRRRGGIRDVENRLQESGVGVLLETELVRTLDGEVLATSSRWLEAGYAIEPGTTPATTPAELTSRRRVVRNLAQGAVLDLFGPRATD